MNQRATGTATGSYFLGIDNSPTGTVEFSTYNGGTGLTVNSIKKVNDGEWHYIVATRFNVTGTSEQGAVYIDGSRSGLSALRPRRQLAQ